MGSVRENEKLKTEVVYINLPGPREPSPGMSSGELLHGFLVDLYCGSDPDIKNYVLRLCQKWNIRYRGESIRGYLVIFEKANGNYSAYSPDVPGCIATGTTRKETEKNIREALSLHIKGLMEDGLPLPEPTSFTEYIEV